ncbi:flavin-binding monooxygenase-like family protein [Leptodontidium sp. MPI-SDFR-AT-0119]|nr:flavin-binding monooxygenase-like family protein [Leptodontidium sp. MPI-SDFR-AT-0119]
MGSVDKGSFESLEEVLGKYEEERQKRLRPEGMAQYADIGLSEHFKHLANDPWVEAEVATSKPCPISDGSHTKVLIVGTGYSALLYAVRLIVEAQFKSEDFVFVDSAWGFGGTWYWNRYPGLMCDVESACYLPLAEETGYIPKHRYSYGPELREYAELVAKQWDLQQRAAFGSTVKETTWNETSSEWETTITRQLPGNSDVQTFKVRSDFFILSSGILNRPKLARLDGITSYKGHLFHTSRWDYAYTGGTPEEPKMQNLVGKKVAFIGTGATAIQVVPQIAKWADQLYLFQRTPSAVGPRGQRPVDPNEFRNQVQTGKGWQQARRENMASFLSNDAKLPQENLVDDGWTNFPSFSGLVGSTNAADLTLETAGAYVASLHQLDLPRQAGIRSRIRNIVKDEETAKLLEPWYPGWCKRPCFHDDYLDTFNLPNVQLIDTNGKGVDGFSEEGIVFDGKVYDADVVILGTGFEPFSVGSPAFRASIKVTGRGGLSMDDKWAEGPHTLHGLITRDFPNLLLAGFTQAAATTNIVHSVDVLAQHAARLISTASRKFKVGEKQKILIEPTAQAESNWSLAVAGNALAYAAVPGCTPSYGTAEGSRHASTPEEGLRLAKNVPWGLGIVDFTRKMKLWEEQEDLSELEISVVSGNAG